MNEKVWKLDPDAVKSAEKVLEKWDGVKTEIIHLPEEPGMSAVAFGLTDVIDRWAANTEELAIDSTCKFLNHQYRQQTHRNGSREHKQRAL